MPWNCSSPERRHCGAAPLLHLPLQDGFPPSLARQNGFQRHATLLIYLNTTTQGGATRFDLLNLAVQPQKGKAVLFFPALSDGTSDPRHAAALLPLPGCRGGLFCDAPGIFATVVSARSTSGGTD